MPEDYYGRQAIEMLDGTKTFQNDGDRALEDEVAKIVGEKWSTEKSKVELRHFAPLSPIDWYAVRYDRVVGLCELKSPRVPITQHKVVFLNVRKWLALSLGAVGMGIPSVFVVRFNDGNILWLPINSVDARRHKIGGCSRIVKSSSDIEPVIEIPIESMRKLSDA